MISSDRFKVFVRVRPMSLKEQDCKSKKCINVDCENKMIKIINLSSEDSEEITEKSFEFDHCFGENSTQAEVYGKTAFPMIESVLNGYSSTIFAYGQTGCGKTYSMNGRPEQDDLKGKKLLNDL